MQGVSHELKAPLARIQFAVELLNSEQSPQKIEQRIQVIRSGASELEEMVNRLLQYVRTDAPRSSSPNWRVPLEPVVQQIFDGERLLHPELSYGIDPQMVADDISILCSVNDLTCVISNTVRNASRFAKQQILVRSYRTANGTVIDIEDDGPGIPEKNREAVFRPFERLSDDRGSAGLGLALVGRILKQYGGWAKVETSTLGGCRIRTFWPKRNVT
jgi:two-component system, OmpR family, sensor histidine kinase RstB